MVSFALIGIGQGPDVSDRAIACIGFVIVLMVAIAMALFAILARSFVAFGETRASATRKTGDQHDLEGLPRYPNH